jgi:hypothetical protein
VKIAVRKRKYRQKLKVKARQRATERDWYLRNLESAREKQRRYRLKARQEAIFHYGGNPPKCECCGEMCYEFLTIDHILGEAPPKKTRRGSSGLHLYIWLRMNGYPSGFRVLCYNCNCAIGNYGYCPHKGMKEGSQ